MSENVKIYALGGMDENGKSNSSKLALKKSR